MSSALEIDDFNQKIIDRSRNDLVFTSQHSTIYLLVISTLIFALVIRTSVDVTMLFIWTLVALASYAARLYLCWCYSNADDDKKASPDWRRMFTMVSAFAGLIWGVGAFMIFPVDSANHQMVMIILVVILAAVSTVTHSAFRWASVSFILTSLTPLTVRVFIENSAGYDAVCFFMVVFSLVMLSSGEFLFRMTNKMFLLSTENAKLIRDLKSSNTQLANRNTNLLQSKDELNAINDDLQKLATTDTLTNLTNRRRFEALAKMKWCRAAEEKTPLTLVLVNIDLFKPYNDFYGKRKGDNCLIKISACLEQLPDINRHGDSVSRYSGDEFAILLFDATESYAKKVAERIRCEVEAIQISCAEMPYESSPWITVSVGVSTETEFMESTFEDMFERVDKALHKAKRGGRNQTCYL